MGAGAAGQSWRRSTWWRTSSPRRRAPASARCGRTCWCCSRDSPDGGNESSGRVDGGEGRDPLDRRDAVDRPVSVEPVDPWDPVDPGDRVVPVAGGAAGGLQALGLAAAAQVLPVLADLLRVRAGGLAQVRLLARWRARRRTAAALPAVPSRRDRSAV